MRFIMDESAEGELLRARIEKIGVSGSLLSHLKKQEDGIVLNGERVTVRAVLHTGDILDLHIEDELPSGKILPVNMPVEAVAETSDFVAVNKPPYMPTHPSHGHYDDTLANALAFHYLETGFHPRFINRLDRNTSGLVLVARHALSAAVLYRQMASGKIRKTYFALVKGRISFPLVFENGICRVSDSVILRKVCPIGTGDFARTAIWPISFSDSETLVRLCPTTGRTHQLRVQLAAMGHPILGDEIYGLPDARIGRQALHAGELSFSDPATGALLTVKAPLPEDFRKATQLIFGREAD